MCKYEIDLDNIMEHLCKNCEHKKTVITSSATLVDQEQGYIQCPAGEEGEGSIDYNGNGEFSCVQGVQYGEGLA